MKKLILFLIIICAILMMGYRGHEYYTQDDYDFAEYIICLKYKINSQNCKAISDKFKKNSALTYSQNDRFKRFCIDKGWNINNCYLLENINTEINLQNCEFSESGQDCILPDGSMFYFSPLMSDSEKQYQISLHNKKDQILYVPTDANVKQNQSRFGFKIKDFLEYFEEMMAAQGDSFEYSTSVVKSPYQPERYPFMMIIGLPDDISIRLYTDKNNLVQHVAFFMPSDLPKSSTRFGKNVLGSIYFFLFPAKYNSDYTEFLMIMNEHVIQEYENIEVVSIPEHIGNKEYYTMNFFEEW